MDYKGFTYYEENITPPKTIPDSHPASKIEFFKNGQSQGIAWSNIVRGTYFPAVSLYMGAQVSLNFGPKFCYSLPSNANSVYSSNPRCFNEAAADNLSRLVLNEILNKMNLKSSPDLEKALAQAQAQAQAPAQAQAQTQAASTSASANTNTTETTPAATSADTIAPPPLTISQ